MLKRKSKSKPYGSFSPLEELLQKLRKLHLTSLRVTGLHVDLIQVFKIVEGFSRLSFDDFTSFFTDYKHNARGHRLMIEKERCNLEVRKHLTVLTES